MTKAQWCVVVNVAPHVLALRRIRRMTPSAFLRFVPRPFASLQNWS